MNFKDILNESNKIPFNKTKRVSNFNSNSAPSSSDKHLNTYLDPNKYIGIISNKYSTWGLFELSLKEKNEFGKNTYRTYSDKTNSISIIKINLEQGTYAFIDNVAYENNVIKFEKMTPYTTLRMLDEPKAHNAFNIEM